MSSDRISHLRRTLLVVSAVTTMWALVVALTGGFVVEVLGVMVSSRNVRNPAIVAFVSGVVGWALPMPNRRQALLDAWHRWMGCVTSVSTRWPWLRLVDLAALVAVAGAWLLVEVWASGRPLWVDEQMIALNLRDRSIGGLAGPLWLGQSAPFGWLAIQRGVLRLFGTGEAALRLVPMLFGALTLAVAVWAGRRWMGLVGAAMFVALCAFAPWLAHYPLELKHYSADAFWGLLLPVLAVWTLEAAEPRGLRRRVALWWVAAALGHWMANGALLVVPACALVMGALVWRRAGRREMLAFAGFGLVWLLSFGLHFALSIRHTLANPFLRDYWAAGVPPAATRASATLAWLGAQLEPLAANPGGTAHWATFWALAVFGFVFARGSLGMILAAVPLSAFALSATRMVPLHDRLALWIVPALYFGAALAADGSLRLARAASTRRSPWRLFVSLVVAVAGLAVCSDVLARGMAGYRSRGTPESNHGLYDRAAVQWLMDRRQSGDALITTGLGLPAIWWYGAVPLADGDPPGSRQPDGGAIFEASYASGADCQRNQLRGTLEGERRVLVYTGFPDQPAGFHELLLQHLSELGTVVQTRWFGDTSRAAVVDLSASPDAAAGERAIAPDGAPSDKAVRDGCVAVRPGARW